MKYWDFLAFPSLPGPDAPVFHPDLKQEHLEGGSFTTVPPWVTTQEEALKYHREYVAQINERDDVIIVKVNEDLHRNSNDKIKVVCNIQQPPHDADIGQLYKEGVRVMCVAYDDINPYGGGFKHQGVGLTDKGRELIEAMVNHSMIIDLSHASHRMAWEVIQFVWNNFDRAHIVASHVGIYEIYDHGRNLPVGTLRCMIDKAESNGRPALVGIPSLTFIMHPTDNTLEPFLRHFDFALNQLGEDHICIGTDGHYQNYSVDAIDANYQKIAAKLDKDEKFRSRNPYQPMVLNCLNRMEVISDALLKKYSSSIVEKTMGKNLYAFLSNALPYTPPLPMF